MRLEARVLAWAGVLDSLAGERGGSIIRDLERSVPPALRFCSAASYRQ
jgi:hypothetical protein